jgi:transposase
MRRRRQAVRLVRQLRAERGQKHGAVQRVARQLGFGVETVRNVGEPGRRRRGRAAGVTSEENTRIRRLEQEVRAQRRDNKILRSASAFFAAELDRSQR